MIKLLQKQLSYTSLLALLLSFFVFVSCGTESNPSMGSLEVRMYDAPIDSASEVNVSVKQVEINQTGSSDGWQTISEPNQTYNLLDLNNGAYEVLGDTTLPTGTYQQIRLVLNDTGNNVVIDGETYEMKAPSGAESGLKLNVNAEIEENINYVLLLDFEASQSVVKAGSNSNFTYVLNPVIRATNKATTGNIAGTISPAEADAALYAVQNSDTLSSTIADTSDGSFELMGLQEGTYSIKIDPRNDNYQSRDTTGIDVTAGETNNIGMIQVESPDEPIL